MEPLYMIELELLNVRTEDFISKVPKQREVLHNLIAAGVVKSYTLALNHSKLWLVATADNEFEIMTLIAQLPLSELMIPSITPLLSHETQNQRKQTALLN